MKNFLIILIMAIGIITVDQSIKTLFLDGFEHSNDCFDLALIFNKGVAFSMFASLGEYLKYIQLTMLIAASIYLFFEQDMVRDYTLALGLIFGAGISNLYDRFVLDGVVDYFYWHCGFDFAIFNFADVMIDLGVAIILIKTYLEYKREKKSKA